jgi:hypothetical protein
MKKFLILSALTILLFSCKTDLVYITVTESAPVSIPGYIKRVGIINRSLPADNNSVLNKIDQILSVKGPELDKAGGEESIRGVKDALMQNNRFEDIAFLDKIDLKTTGAGIFPSPLSWDVVENICRDNNINALFVLELFDTDSKINYAAVPVTAKTPLGDVPAIEHHASMVTTVKAGWRMYDPKSRTILDEFSNSESLTFGGSGINPLAAAASLLERKEAVKQTGYKAGRAYAYRIVPVKIRVSREYYVKGTDNFKIAKRMSRTGNWDNAAELWKKETSNTSSKIRGRAYYNMAISNEINGNLDEAISWAQKSYEECNNRKALHYVNILKFRRNDNNRLKRQMDEASH